MEIGKQIVAQNNLLDSVNLIINLSLSLVLINSLPFTPFDGGKLYAYLIGKINRTAEQYYTLGTGFIMLLLIMLILFRDVFRLIVGFFS